MRAFVIGLLTAVILAGAAGYILERHFSLDAEMAFSTSSARVGEENSAEARGWFPG